MTNILQDRHSQLGESMRKNPYLLNDLTNKYLKYLNSTTHTQNTASWQTIQQVFQQMNSSVTSIEQCILLFNVARLVLGQTIGMLSGINENRMYCWMSMLYGVKCTAIIEQIQSILSELQRSLQSQGISPKDKQMNTAMLLKYACFGLLFSEMMISMVQKTNKADTSNKVMYPQLYRLINLILVFLTQYEKLDINMCIFDYSNKKNVEYEEKKQKINITEIIQILQQKQYGKSKTVNNKQQCISNRKVVALITAKTIEILNRSFQICSFKQISKLHIIKNMINQQIKKLINIEQLQINEEIEIIDKPKNKQNLKEIIQEYLNSFITGAQSKLNGENIEQFDEEDKIIKVRELTPRLVDEIPSMKLKKLRVKKKKLIKKIQSDGKKATLNRLQERKVIQDVKIEKTIKKQKKDMFIIQKQAQQAKKQQNKIKRIKQIQKQRKGNKITKSHKKKN